MGVMDLQSIYIVAHLAKIGNHSSNKVSVYIISHSFTPINLVFQPISYTVGRAYFSVV